MDKEQRAEQLHNAISCGHFAGVKRILDDVTSADTVNGIEKSFTTKYSEDPLICAINENVEEIALYLLEKGFNHRLLYNYQACDEWCYCEHLEDKCPREYDALDLSGVKKLTKLQNTIKEIRLGRRMPGDGLALMQNPEFKREDSSLSYRKVRSPSATNASTSNTKANLARRWARELGLDYLSRTGETIIHLCDTPAKVHVCANLGVHINIANFVGDTALHQAVRNGQRNVCQALLMNGADPLQKNKLGQTPLDECSGYIRRVCEKFKTGLLHAVMKGEYNTLQRLIRMWCNPESKISRDGSSAMELAESKQTESDNHRKLYNIMKAHHNRLKLTHAVLSEDILTIKKILITEKGWCLNKRFKDIIGETMVCCAIEQHNLEVIQLLVEQEVSECNLNIRVREVDEEGVTETVPLLFKTLENDCPEEIWSYMDDRVDCFQASEKDASGYTALHRAIINGKSSKFICRFIKRHHFECLTDRNMYGQTARELASSNQRLDVVHVIDEFIVAESKISSMSHFPVNFYGFENLPSMCNLPQEKYSDIEANAVKLHQAVVNGDRKNVLQLNDANYRDKNGYTALIRAIVCRQLALAEELVTERPVLKVIPDNCNRYPLHYAYALSEQHGEPFIKLLVEKNPEDIEFKVDKDGRTAAEYKVLRNSAQIRQMIIDVMSLDPYRERTTPVLPNINLESVTQDIVSNGRES